MKTIEWKNAIVNALLTAVYVIAVGLFIYYGSSIKLGRTNTFLAPISLLLLLVLSAAVTGFLIFGKPAQLYVDGKKKEALSLLFNTLAVFAFITFLFLLLLITLTG